MSGSFVHESVQDWTDALFFSFDRNGKEQLLHVDGAQVTMEWEKPYMKSCVNALHIESDCDVLEVGFGCGYSAEYIQRACPKSHTIIECGQAVLERLYRWAADKPNVRVVEGTWQTKLPELGVFDRIFLDDYARVGREEIEMMKCPNPQYIKAYECMDDHFNGFLNIAFKWHSRNSTLLSGYMTTRCGAEDLARTDFKMRYKYISVEPPEHCNYFFSRRACVAVFQKITKGGSTQGKFACKDRRARLRRARSMHKKHQRFLHDSMLGA